MTRPSAGPVGPVLLGVAGAAGLIAAVTILARITGFGRILAFSRTVGQTCLGDTYQTVNTVPNIVFEIVAGGALASLVVPLLARAVNDGDQERASRISSALLTWSVLLLTPMAVAVAVFAEQISELLLGSKGCAGAVEVGASMLRVFAPQVVLYGVGIVLTGVLHAHRKFGGAALAPLLSSLVVIAAYLFFGQRTPSGTDVGTLDRTAELILSVGTTLGVVTLALSLALPLARLGLRLRPTLRFPDGVAGRARRLAAAGVAALIAQQISVAVALLLGNGAGVPAGSVTVFTYAQTIYLLPWAVFAVPIAMSVFPRLADRWDAADVSSYSRLLSGATRAVTLTALLAAAVLIAAAEPIARIVVESAPGRPSVSTLAAGITAFAPGLLGYGWFALLSRALYARGEARSTAIACVAGWLAVVVADVVLAVRLPPQDRVLVLAVGNSVGMTLLGVALLGVVIRRAGGQSLAGLARTAGAGLLGAVVAGIAGRVIADVLDAPGILAAVWATAAVTLCVVVLFGVMMVVTARSEVRAAMSVLNRGRAHQAAAAEKEVR
ncbi:MAG: virulence factor MviN [Geodermatophilaceae bacterium]|nr:virulence factor MviN [Geodermatophilaceae bacterium]